MIEIKDLTKKYSGKTALGHINLTIPQGQLIGLFGENGAGKTTLMKCILGYLRFQGTVALDGEPITSRNIGKISFATCEHSFFPNLTARDHRDFYELHFPSFRRRRFAALMEFFALPKNKSIRSFSMGQQNQFEVVMALSQGADYILMDEPFSGNDIFNREDFYKVLLGMLEPTETVLLSTHLLEEVNHIIDRALLLHNGLLIADQETAGLEEEGITLTSFVRRSFGYNQNRIADFLSSTEESN